MLKIRERTCSPYLAGVIIGLLLVPAMVIVDTVLYPPAEFAAGSGNPFSALIAGDSRSWWHGALLVGIVFGAMLSVTAANSRRTAPSPIWTTVLGTSSRKARAVTGFIGGFLMLFGASLAGGDFVAHSLSGIAQLGVGSIIALIAIVGGGVAAGRLLRRS